MTKFDNIPAALLDLRMDAEDALEAAGVYFQFGASNQSISAYITVDRENEEGEVEQFCIRISDHAATASALSDTDISIRVEDRIEEVLDECGEYSHVEVDYASIKADLDEAIATAIEWANA